MIIIFDEMSPFKVLRHRNWSSLQFLDCVVTRIGFALQYSSVSVVRLLDLADDDCLELRSGSFQVEIRLIAALGGISAGECGWFTYLVQIVLFVNLSLNLSVYGQSQQIGILLASSLGRIKGGLAKSLLQVIDGFSCVFHLLANRAFEIARETLDLLDLLL